MSFKFQVLFFQEYAEVIKQIKEKQNKLKKSKEKINYITLK